MSASIPLRSITMALALGLVACDSEEAPTEPSGGARPALAAVAGYTAVDLARGLEATAPHSPSTRQARSWGTA